MKQFTKSTKKMDGVLFKIDFEKDYDKAKWPFVQHVLRMKGLNLKWCDFIKHFVQGDSVEIGSTMILLIISKQETG
jgi:hypothetical protein